MIKEIYGALALSVGMIVSVPAFAITLDFDTGAASYSGANTLTGYSQDGLVFAISMTANGGDSTGANLFDTTCPATANCSSGGDDRDLVPTRQGENGVENNVLILQEDGASLADDSRKGGEITFTLLSGSAFSILGFSAVDDGTFSIEDEDGTLGAVSLSSNNETGLTLFATASDVITIGDSFTVKYSGSGGVDSIALAVVPLPAALPMLLAGLGGFGLVARRRRKA